MQLSRASGDILLVVKSLIVSRDSFIFSLFSKMIRSLICSVAILDYYINTPAGGEKDRLMCYVNESIYLLQKTHKACA